MYRLIILLGIFLSWNNTYAQQVQIKNETQKRIEKIQNEYIDSMQRTIATNIGNRLSDSLGLDTRQRANIIQISYFLERKKAAAWRYTKDQGLIQRHLQEIENNRDKLYDSIMSRDQYAAYLQRKSTLLRK